MSSSAEEDALNRVKGVPVSDLSGVLVAIPEVFDAEWACVAP
jgi:hypothetical protein